jgi:hypothetical protein
MAALDTPVSRDTFWEALLLRLCEPRPMGVSDTQNMIIVFHVHWKLKYAISTAFCYWTGKKLWYSTCLHPPRMQLESSSARCNYGVPPPLLITTMRPLISFARRSHYMLSQHNETQPHYKVLFQMSSIHLVACSVSSSLEKGMKCSRLMWPPAKLEWMMTVDRAICFP